AKGRAWSSIGLVLALVPCGHWAEHVPQVNESSPWPPAPVFGTAAARHTEGDDAGEPRRAIPKAVTPGSRAVAIIVSVKINDGIVVAADSAGAMPERAQAPVPRP